MSRDRAIPPFDLVGAVHERLDGMGTWISTARDHAGSRVWRVDLPDRAVFVKQHHQARKRRQEVAALRHWTPRLASQHRVPVWLADLPAFEAVVMSAVPGVEADRAPPADPRALWRAAGRFLRALHDLPVTDPDPFPLHAAIAARVTAWCGRAEGLVPAATIEAVRARADPEAFRGVARVPCHRDYQVRNWLIEGDALAVVDWEHAAPDLAEADLVRVAAAWTTAPALREAFLAGYGGLDPAQEDRLARMLPLFGLATLVWALEHRDAAFEAAGRSVLENALRAA